MTQNECSCSINSSASKTNMHKFNTYAIQAFAIPFMDGEYDVHIGDDGRRTFTVTYTVKGKNRSFRYDDGNGQEYALRYIKCTWVQPINEINRKAAVPDNKNDTRFVCIFKATTAADSDNNGESGAVAGVADPIVETPMSDLECYNNNVPVSEMQNGGEDGIPDPWILDNSVTNDQRRALVSVLQQRLFCYYNINDKLRSFLTNNKDRRMASYVTGFAIHVKQLQRLLFHADYNLNFHTFERDAVEELFDGRLPLVRHDLFKMIGSDVHECLKEPKPEDSAKWKHTVEYVKNCNEAVDTYCRNCKFLGECKPEDLEEGKEYRVYYPYSMFSETRTDLANLNDYGTETEYARNYANDGNMDATYKMLTAHIDRVMIVGTKVVVVEYKCIMGMDDTTSRLVFDRVTNNATKKQVMLNATLFHLCTGVQPDYVMTVHCTRTVKGGTTRSRGPEYTLAVHLEEKDLDVVVTRANVGGPGEIGEERASRSMDRSAVGNIELITFDKGTIEKLQEYWSVDKSSLKSFCEKILDCLVVKEILTKVSEKDGYQLNEGYTSVSFSNAVSGVIRVYKTEDGTFFKKCHNAQWKRWRERQGVRAYVQMHEYSYDGSKFKNRHTFLERLCTNPLGLQWESGESSNNAKIPRVLYCDDKYLIPSLNQMLQLRPINGNERKKHVRDMLFDHMHRDTEESESGAIPKNEYNSLRWSLPHMRIFTNLVHVFETDNKSNIPYHYSKEHRLMKIRTHTTRTDSTAHLDFETPKNGRPPLFTMDLMERDIRYICNVVLGEEESKESRVAFSSSFELCRVKAVSTKRLTGFIDSCYFFVLLPDDANEDVKDKLIEVNDHNVTSVYKRRGAKSRQQDGVRLLEVFSDDDGYEEDTDETEESDVDDDDDNDEDDNENEAENASGAEGEDEEEEDDEEEYSGDDSDEEEVSFVTGGAHGDEASAAASNISALDELQRTLNGDVLHAAELICEEVMQCCRYQCKGRNVNLRDVWDCFLLYYDIVEDFVEEKGKGDDDAEHEGMCVLQFMFQPDLETRSPPYYKIGHHYTRSKGVYLESILVNGDTVDTIKQICIRTLHRLINQRVMQIFIPMRIMRPEAIFKHFGTNARGVQRQNAIFSSIRGLHIPEPPASSMSRSGEEGNGGGDGGDGDNLTEYAEFYGKHKEKILVYDSSFREMDDRVLGRTRRSNGRGRDDGSVFGASETDEDEDDDDYDDDGNANEAEMEAALVPTKIFVNDSKESFSIYDEENRCLKGSRETWNDTKPRRIPGDDVTSRPKPFIRSGKTASSHYRKGFILDLFCHDSQRGKWSHRALEEALAPVIEFGNAKPVRIAAADLVNHFIHTIEFVLAHRQESGDRRTMSILKDICQQHGLM